MPSSAKPAVRTIEQRDVRLDDALRQAFAIDREPVVHRDDLDLVGREVLHGMVGAVVALMHLACRAAERQSQHLMSEADAEHWLAAVDQLLDFRNRVFAGRRRISRAIRQKYAVGIARQHVLGLFGRGDDRHLAAG